jgi:hypothetical protein
VEDCSEYIELGCVTFGVGCAETKGTLAKGANRSSDIAKILKPRPNVTLVCGYLSIVLLLWNIINAYFLHWTEYKIGAYTVLLCTTVAEL